MKTTQYVRQEKAISAADTSGIRERWLWGLRLLRDPDAFAPNSTQLKPGRAEELIRAMVASGQRISEREIRYRLRCARAYKTEAEIRQAIAEFGSWSALFAADFPAFPVPEGEPAADHRTDAERQRDRARALEDILGEQGALFPLSDFEPSTATLKELVEYADEMEEWTGRRVSHDRKRREYLEQLIAAADDDLSVTWLEAQHRAIGGSA